MYLLPIVWLAIYGKRLHLLIGLFCMDLALLVPLLFVGAPKYPTIEWREVIVMATVTTLVASTVYTMVSRDRAFLGNLTRQSRLARRAAREADYSRDRLETLLRAATGSAIMGVDPAGTVTFFSAGAEQMLGFRAAEVVGIRSIADFIDPAQIDERRQTIDAMRTALEPIDAEAAAEVPWTATRKDGQQRRCVVRVRALPVPTPEPGFDGNLGEDQEQHDEDGQPTLEGLHERDTSVLGPATGGYVVVAIDVTEREELAADRERLFAIQKEVTQSLIEQNNRLRELTQMKDDVVATVSHELRTPITSIRGFIELLVDESAHLTESEMRMLRTIDRNAEQLQRVAEDLLADPGAGRGLRVAFTELDLNRLTEEAVHAMQTSAAVAGILLTMEPGREVPIFGDPGRLHQLHREPALQRHQVLAAWRACARHCRRRRRLRPGAGARRGAGHPRDRAGPALRALLPPGLLDGDGCAGHRPRAGHRQVGGRGPRGLRRHSGHAGVVDDLPRLPPVAHDDRGRAGAAARTGRRGRPPDGARLTQSGWAGPVAAGCRLRSRNHAAMKPPDWWAHRRP